MSVLSKVNEFKFLLTEEEKSEATIEKYIIWNEAEDFGQVEIWIPVEKR